MLFAFTRPLRSVILGPTTPPHAGPHGIVRLCREGDETVWTKSSSILMILVHVLVRQIIHCWMSTPSFLINSSTLPQQPS
jgi:hypothetical protein